MSGRSRILIIGPPKSGKLELIKTLTGSLPTIIGDTHAGLLHKHEISNQYYDATVDIWVDEFAGADQDSVDEWVKIFCSDEAKIVRDVLGAVIYTFDPEIHTDYRNEMGQVGKFIQQLEDEMWDGVCLAVSRNTPAAMNDIEDLALDNGFEHVNIKDNTSSEQGKQGMDRIREAIETYQWSTSDGDGGDWEDVNANEVNGADDDEDINFDQMTTEDKEAIAKLINGLNNKSIVGEKDVDKWEEVMTKLKNAQKDDNMTNEEKKQLSDDLASELIRLKLV